MASDSTSSMILEAFKNNTIKSVFSRSIHFKEARSSTNMTVDSNRYIKVNPQKGNNSAQSTDIKEIDTTPIKTKGGKKKKNQTNSEYGFLDSLFDPSTSKNSSSNQQTSNNNSASDIQASVINNILTNMKNTSSSDKVVEPKRVKGKFQVEILSESANDPIQFNNNNQRYNNQRAKQSSNLGEKWDNIDSNQPQPTYNNQRSRNQNPKNKLFKEADEWDEEYDQGKTKKLRHKEQRFMEKFEDKNNLFQKEQDLKNYIKKKKL